MSYTAEIRKTYKYRLYRCDKKDHKLRHMIFVASTIWNHFIALQRRYYRLTGKCISLDNMDKHVLKLRRTKRFVLWQDLHSQACQNVCRRVDDAYQRYFNKLAKGRPSSERPRNMLRSLSRSLVTKWRGIPSLLAEQNTNLSDTAT